ncbi:hypothetical protein HN51_038116 [Arachis hypogaea]|uniref:Late embryogenesis abundant protein LEA-2 subgroup domain-containing protein n=4 Tax=Arachis TaxID=3817 RepID=A0A444ZTK0_ARAHY|nr:NDR1/HIN1-like protein 13 isoform X1 [Arachis duranensis]XP_025691283.1 NDR1/HIN1-like protein 13 [Arachis hypogaea]RYR17412.1 hypothetical protein Ahy_B03g062163 [Arachis hypogaea]
MMTRGGNPPFQPNGEYQISRLPPPPSHSYRPQNRQHYAPPPSRPPSSSSKSSSCKACCCCMFLLVSFLSLVLLVILLALVLSIKPKKPQVDLIQVDVQYVSITSNDPATTATTATLSLAIRLLFAVVNPNRVGIRYGDSRFTVMYRGIPLARVLVPGFYQDPHCVKDVVTAVAVDRLNLLQADAAELISDAVINDRVEFRVLGNVAARIRVLRLFDSPRVQVSVDCVIVISPRKQSLSYKQCGIDALNV